VKIHLTVEDILAWNPCKKYRIDNGAIIRRYFGDRDSMKLSEIVGLDAPLVDLLWIMEKVIPRPLFGQIVCDWAERSLEPFEKRFPDDTRLRNNLIVARRVFMGKLDEDSAWAAMDSAVDVAENAYWISAWNVRESAMSVSAAACSAGHETNSVDTVEAAFSTAMSASNAIDGDECDECEWQIEHAIKLIEDWERESDDDME